MIAWETSYSILMLCVGQVLLALGIFWVARAIKFLNQSVRGLLQMQINHAAMQHRQESE